MRFSDPDLDAAVETVARFLEGRQDSLRFHLQASTRSGSEARLVARSVTPSGKLLQIVELRQQGHAQAEVVRLVFTEPSGSALHSKARAQSRLAGIFRIDRARLTRARQREAVFHLLLPGGASPTTSEDSSSPVCPTCSGRFHRTIPEQGHCCGKCELGRKPKKWRHAENCTRIITWRQGRKLRAVLGAPPRNGQARYGNLIAGEADKDALFLQFVIYATRSGWRPLSPADKEEVFLRFVRRFKKYADIGVLYDAWRKIQQGYTLPGRVDGFSRYARRTIALVKRSAFAREESEAVPREGAVWEEVPSDEAPPGWAEDETAPIDAPVEAAVRGQLKSRTSNSLANTAPSPRKAAAFMGVVERTFYALLEEGVVPAKKEKGEWVLLPGWEEAARKWLASKQRRLRQAEVNNTLAERWASSRGIPVTSAKKQVKRLRARGLTPQEILERIKAAETEARQFLTEQEREAV